ncbi:MAG: protein kinase domain-containing protein, partial [Planctomycetota bacterium]
MAHLVVEAGKEKGSKIPLPADGVVTFGRDTGCGHQIMDLSASRVHFQIHVEGGKSRLEDLDSRNGTYVNEERIKAVELAGGDEVRVGDTIFTFYDGAPPGAEPVPIEPDSIPKPFDPLVGKNVGGYQILEMIGRGGMGTVYKANQVSLNRTVALKILSRRYTSDEKFTDMFVKEARAAGALNHPNIVQVYDVGREGDLHYFSMEHMARGTVGDMLKELGTISVPRSIAMILHAAKGLEYADRKGLIHCDIKPDNLMLNEEGTVKIVDLGLSRTTMGEKEKEGEGEGDVAFGTPHFVAPEQAQRKKIDHRADLYSLGASFFLMITGYPVFLGDSAREIVVKHIKEPPPKAGEINAAIPDSVSQIIDRLLKKSPDDRFPNATALLEDLKRSNIEINPQAAYTDGFPGMPAQEKSRPTGLIVLGAGVLVILLAAIFILPGLLGGEEEGNGGNPGETGTTTENPEGKGETEAERRAREADEAAQKKLDERERKLDEREQQAIEEEAFKDLKAVGEFEKKHGLRGDLSPDVLKKYQALARKYPKTEAGKIAAGKAEEYGKAQAAYHGKQKEASDVLEGLLAKMRPLVKAQKFGKALAVLETFPVKKYEDTDAVDELPNAMRFVRERAADEWATGLANAKAAEGRGDISTARAFFDKVVSFW